MTKHIQLRLEDAEYADFRKKTEAAGYASMQEAGRDALLRFYSRSDGESPKIPQQLREYPGKLERILASGDALAINMVITAIDYAAGDLSRKAARSSTR